MQSSSGLAARGQAWLRAGTVSEGWQKEATVCLSSPPQGWECSVFLSPEASSPAVQDLAGRHASPCLPPGHTLTWPQQSMAPPQHCGTRVGAFSNSIKDILGKGQHVQQKCSTGDLERGTQTYLQLRYHQAQQTRVGAEAQVGPMI